jgi:ABC-type polysaccharide/polyol phosphate export permease
VAFPHRLLVYASVLACCAVHAVGFVADPGRPQPLRRPIHPSGLPIALLLMVPYMLLAAAWAPSSRRLQVLLRDVEHVVSVLITILFYASPSSIPRASSRPRCRAG